MRSHREGLTTGTRLLLLAAALALSTTMAACKRGGNGGESRSGSFFSGGDVSDTTVRFGRLDTALLTNGPGWTRQHPGVGPPAPQQLPGPPMTDTLAPADSGARPRADTMMRADSQRVSPRPMRPRRDTLSMPDTTGRPRQGDSSRARPKQPTQPDTTKPDSVAQETGAWNQG